MTQETEAARNADFTACAILKSYVAALLDDAQYAENDAAAEDGREPLDTGTVYTLAESEYIKCKESCVRFMGENAADLDAADDLELGQPGLQYSRGRYIDSDMAGYYFYMQRVGHGVGFTDHGDAPCLARLSEAASNFGYMESPYFGDDGLLYLCGGDS